MPNVCLGGTCERTGLVAEQFGFKNRLGQCRAVHLDHGLLPAIGQEVETDGLFDICLMRGRKRRNLVRYIWSAIRHRIGKLPDVDILRGTSIELAAEDEAPIQADGDFIGTAPARIELLPVHLPVIVP